MRTEPVLLLGVLRLGLLMLMSFGLDWTTTQVASVMAFAEAALMIVTRTQVAPVNSVGELRKAPDGVVTRWWKP